MTETKQPSDVANELFDQGYSVEEVADELRQRYQPYKQEGET